MSDGGSSSRCDFLACTPDNFCQPGQTLENCSQFNPGVCLGEAITTAFPITSQFATTVQITELTTHSAFENTTAERCPAVCGDPMNPVTCEELMEEFDIGCEEASSFQGGCDCSTCSMCIPTTVGETTSAAETTMSAVCPETCLWNGQGFEFRSCDYFKSTTTRSCVDFEEQFGCDCSGCELCENITSPRQSTLAVTTLLSTTAFNGTTTTTYDHGDCPVTCGDPLRPTSCNELVDTIGISCVEIESSRGCDCSNCSRCDTTTTTTTTTTTVVNTTTVVTSTSETCMPSCGVDDLETCEDMMYNRDWSCPQAEELGGCDCFGCRCPEVPSTTVGLPCYGVCDPDIDYTWQGAQGPCGGPESAQCCVDGGDFVHDSLGLNACFCDENVCGRDGFFCRNCDNFVTSTTEMCPQCGERSEFGTQNCDDIATNLGMQCDEIESLYDCSCFGCQTCTDVTDSPTVTATDNFTTTPERCPAQCGLDNLSCDELIAIDEQLFGNQSTATCESIEEEFGCSCSGCFCDDVCEATCGDAQNPQTCDDIMATTSEFDTCEEIEMYYNSGQRRFRRFLQDGITTSRPESTNDACYTNDQGVMDCVNFEPPGVCCSVSQGPEIMTRCMPVEQCAQQLGSYPGQSTGTTTEIIGGSGVTLATTTPVEQFNDACQTSNEGELDCLGQEPAGVCCTMLQGDQWVTRCSPLEQCEMQDGSFPALDTTTTTSVDGTGGGPGGGLETP